MAFECMAKQHTAKFRGFLGKGRGRHVLSNSYKPITSNTSAIDLAPSFSS